MLSKWILDSVTIGCLDPINDSWVVLRKYMSTAHNNLTPILCLIFAINYLARYKKSLKTIDQLLLTSWSTKVSIQGESYNWQCQLNMGYPQIQYSFSSVLKLENLASMNEPCTNDFIPKLQHFDTSMSETIFSNCIAYEQQSP